MAVTKKKSKKQSAANSRSQRNAPTLFIDRSLGNIDVATPLRNAGVQVEIHDDHLPQNSPDSDWIALVGRRGWVAITKDKNIRYRTVEIQAVLTARARVLVVRAKNLTGSQIGETLSKSLSRIQKFTTKTKSPFIAGIDRSGKITNYNVGT